MTKRIVLCADDYGQASSISAGIIDLIKQRRLSATSCLVNTDHWLAHAEQLRPYQAQIDIGLHFNLTEGQPISAEYKEVYGDKFFSLPKVMIRAALRSLNQAAIAAECEAQILRFREGMGFLPNFVDGHQHVHQFPVIREAVISAYQAHLKGSPTYMRVAKESLMLRWNETLINLKKMIINNMGANTFKRHLSEENIPYNQSFAGIYTFKNADTYNAYFRHFLREISDRGLIMCHPGKQPSEPNDAIGKARLAEYQYFSSKEFLDDCKTYDVAIGRLL